MFSQRELSEVQYGIFKLYLGCFGFVCTAMIT